MTRGAPATDEVFRTVLGSRQPDVLAALTEAHEAAWLVTDADLLDLCRVRIAMLLGFDAGLAAPDLGADRLADLAVWPTSSRFTSRERACLAFAEQFVIDVASMDDATVAALVDELGGDSVVNFANALLVVEQRQRLHLMVSRLLPDRAS